MSLKKTIYELKSQIDGKGGLHSEYEKIVKSLQKSEAELQAELDKLRHES